MNCNWCKYQIDKKCINNNSCISFSEYQPKEKFMENKVIFESEEEFDAVFDDCGLDKSDESHTKNFTRQFVKERFKQKGYIRKSAVEEAEEMLNNIINHIKQGQNYSLDECDYDIIYEGFRELKAEIERLKK